MKKEALETLIITGYFEGKKSRGEHRVTHLTSLYMWNLEWGLGWMVKGHTLDRATEQKAMANHDCPRSERTPDTKEESFPSRFTNVALVKSKMDTFYPISYLKIVTFQAS